MGLKVEKGQTIVENVCVAVDCGIISIKMQRLTLLKEGLSTELEQLYSGLNLKQGPPRQLI